MKVKAIFPGYYNHVRQRPGAVFTLKDPKHFSKKWMEPLESEDVQSPKGNASRKNHGKTEQESASEQA